MPKISLLPPAGPLDGTEQVPMVQDGDTVLGELSEVEARLLTSLGPFVAGMINLSQAYVLTTVQSLALDVAGLSTLVTGGSGVPVPPVSDPAPLFCSDGITPALIDMVEETGLFAVSGYLHPSKAAFLTAIGATETGVILTIGPWEDTANPLNAGNIDLSGGATGWTPSAGAAAAVVADPVFGGNALQLSAIGGTATIGVGFQISNAAYPARSYILRAEFRRGTIATAANLRAGTTASGNQGSSTANANQVYIEGSSGYATRADANNTFLSLVATGTPGAGLTHYLRNPRIYERRPMPSWPTPVDGWTFVASGVTPPAGAGTQVFLGAGNLISTNYVRLYYDRPSGGLYLRVNSIGANILDVLVATVAAETPFAVAGVIKSGRVIASANGFNIAGGTGSQLVPGLAQLRMGQASDGTLDWTGARTRLTILPEAAPNSYIEYLAARAAGLDFIVTNGDSGMDGAGGFVTNLYLEQQMAAPVINLAVGGTTPDQQLAALNAARWLRGAPYVHFDMGNGGITDLETEYFDQIEQALAFQQTSIYTIIPSVVFAAAQTDTVTVGSAANAQLLLAQEQTATLLTRYGAAHVLDILPVWQALARPAGTALGDKDQDDISKGFAPRSLSFDGVHPGTQSVTGIIVHQAHTVPAIIAHLAAQS